jgi:hypothetical protein
METEKMIETSLENREGQFPIYKTKSGRIFLGLYKDLNSNSVIGLGISDGIGIKCSDEFLEETGELGSMTMRSILKDKFIS